MRRIPINEMLLISAVRYALGRRTYIVGVTVEEVLNSWPDLSDNTRSVILRDVRDAHELGDDMGHPCDRAEWMRILKETSR